MPHAARKRSASGYYHVVPKGIHDQVIFENDGDRSRYLELLREAKERFGIRIHAYCLMGNHVHLVLEDERNTLSQFMKFVDERYGAHVAESLGRKGGVFVRPFWSEPIEEDGYLLCAVRYVHANPAAAGICPASAYEWSSAKDYLGRKGIADTDMVLDMLGGQKGFIDFSRASNATGSAFPGSKLKNHLTDQEALTLAQGILGMKACDVGLLPRMQRDAALELLANRGFSLAQIARITGVGRGCCRAAATKG